MIKKVTITARLKHYLDTDQTFFEAYEYTKKRFDEAQELTAHNWEHAYRDVINAMLIGEAEQADMSIVLPATVMHDIGFLYGASGQNHGAVGAEKLAEYLLDADIEMEPEKVDHIAACILTHKGSMHGEVPETLEAKVVSDADLLEKFGPIGVYQGIRTFTEFNFSIDEVIARLKRGAELTFQTETGTKLSEPIRLFPEIFAKSLADANALYQGKGTDND